MGRDVWTVYVQDYPWPFRWIWRKGRSYETKELAMYIANRLLTAWPDDRIKVVKEELKHEVEEG